MSINWWDDSIRFFYADLGGQILNEELLRLFQFLTESFTALGIFCWIYSFFSLTYNKLLKPAMIISLIIVIPYPIIMFLIFAGPSELYDILGRIQMIFNIIYILILLLSGILFVNKSRTSDDIKIVWKSRFLLMAFICFSIASISMAVFWTIYGIEVDLENVPWLFFIPFTIILIFSAIEYYLGFFMPDWLVNLLTWKKSKQNYLNKKKR